MSMLYVLTDNKMSAKKTQKKTIYTIHLFIPNYQLNGPYTGSLDVDSLMAKVEELTRSLDQGINPGDRVFDPRVWSQILDRTSTWIWDSSQSPLE